MAGLEVLDYVFYYNSIEQYIIAAAIFFMGIAVLHIFKYSFLHKARKIAARTPTKLDDSLVEAVDVNWPFLFFLSLYLALKFIFLPQTIFKYVNDVMLIIVTYYLVRAVCKFIEYFIERNTKEDSDAAALEIISILAKAAVWIIAVIFIISNLGYNISTLLAGLGIGGIAIAFALQNVLADIFASIAIYIDKPFRIGDFIIVGTDMGTVQKVGIKSTRIKTLEGQELVVSNRELTETRVNNYGTMKRRRVATKIGVTYQTASKKLKAIPGMISEIVEKVELATFDRAHWKDYGDSALIFEFVYYVESPDYNTYMDVQQEINQKIFERFAKQKIEFAYPTQTIYTKK